RPLLGVWELYDLDLQVTVQRSGTDPRLIGWGGLQSPRLRTLAREWYGLPHRSRLFRDVAATMMLSRPELRPFFEEVRRDWARLLDEQGEPEKLRLLIERLNPQNYRERPQEDGSVLIEFAWPEEIQRRQEADQHRLDEQFRLMMFPWQCRER